MRRRVIFTDMDGTLLEHGSYSFERALPALRMVRERGIPLVLCSSKSREEMEWYRERLENGHPFIAENGGGVFIPRGYFKDPELPKGVEVEQEAGYLVLRLGASYRALRRALRELRDEGFGITGFGDMTVREVAELTGLPEDQAAMAKARDFDEPFLFNGDAAATERLLGAIRGKGFKHTQGRLFHILGDSDKGKAVVILSGLYRRKYGEITTIALGDGLNDLPMLACVDRPVLVKNPDGLHDPRIRIPGLMMADGIGPAGWSLALMEILCAGEG